MRILLLSTLIFSVSGIFQGILHSHNHFLLPALAPILFDVGILFGVMVLVDVWGVYGIAWGAVIGSALHFGIQVPGLFKYRMRWWATHGASWAASLSVLGWHSFMGPMVRRLGEEKLEALLGRIPNKQRRIYWATAAKSTFTEEQLQNARDGVATGVQMMDRRLRESPYFAGESYSIADIVIFANAYALPLMHDYAASDELSPAFMDWIRRIYRRPAIAEAFRLGRTPMRERAEAMISRCLEDVG